MIITRKIELTLHGDKEEKQRAWAVLKDFHNKIPILNNFIVTHLITNELIKDKFYKLDEYLNGKIKGIEAKINDLYEKIKKLKKSDTDAIDKEYEAKKKKILADIDKLQKEKYSYINDGRKKAQDTFKEAYEVQIDGSINQVIREDEVLRDLPDTIISPAISELKFYKKNLPKIRKGEERIRFYSKGMPFNTRGRDLKFYNDEDEHDIYMKWIKGIHFKLIFGKDSSNNREIVTRIMSDTYKASDSKIHLNLRRGKIFLLLCVDIPEKDHHLDKNTVVGVDLGLAYPAYCALNNNYQRVSVGKFDDFTRIRTQLQKRLNNLQKSVKIAKGGKGRKRKLKAQEQYHEKERNWVKTYNHNVSKQIINFALQNNAGIINLEFLKGYGENETNSFVLRNWSYFELQQMIEYKAKMHKIEIRYIDPYLTSQTCSKCGNYEEGQRLDQKSFQCKKCGYEEFADYNAAKNIALSTKVVSSKQECEYFRKSVDV